MTCAGPRSGLGPGPACLVAGAALGLAAGCVETQVTQVNKPMFAGLPGVDSGGGSLASAFGQSRPEILQPVEQIRVENPDGTITLRAPTVRDLMRHILETLVRDEEEIFTQQVLSTITRREFVERGYDPREAFRELKRRQGDIRGLFQAMPMGEFTPGILLRPIGKNMFRLHSEGDRSMPYRFMDVVFEGGDYRLRWFGR